MDLRAVEEIEISAEQTIVLADRFDPFSVSFRRAFVTPKKRGGWFSLLAMRHRSSAARTEDKALTNRFMGPSAWDMRKEIEEHTNVREKTSTAVDLPLSNESMRVLAYSAEEAERLNEKHIGTEHLLLRLLREEKCYAAKLLADRNVKLEVVREELGRKPHEPTQRGLAEKAVDVMAKAASNFVCVEVLHPLIGRKGELERVIHTLGATEGRIRYWWASLESVSAQSSADWWSALPRGRAWVPA
jgi:hypothetical protein